jgi:membrane-associated phospholipid phosphatase
VMRYVGIAVTRLSIAAGLCLLCIFFVDGPVARLFSESVLHLDQRKYAVGSPVLLVPLAALAAFLVFWGRRARRTPTERAIILAAVSGLAAFATNNLILKPLFGRRSTDEFLYWPSHYGFYFFKGDWHTNFPSGHMALVVAIATIGWREFPSLRWVIAAAVALASFLLLFGEWHFVSDLIAGACWGNLVALTVVALSERLTTGSPRCGADEKH